MRETAKERGTGKEAGERQAEGQRSTSVKPTYLINYVVFQF